MQCPLLVLRLTNIPVVFRPVVSPAWECPNRCLKTQYGGVMDLLSLRGGEGRGWEVCCHGRMNYKDTEPLMSAFLQNWPVNELCGIVFNRFYRLEILSLMVGIFDPACDLLPPWTKELYLCTVAPLPSLWPPPPSPLPILNVQYLQTVCGCGGGGWVLNCVVDHILQEF